MNEKQYTDYSAHRKEPLKRIPCTLQKWGIIELMKTHEPAAVMAVGGRFSVGVVMRKEEFEQYVTVATTQDVRRLTMAMLAIKKAGLIEQAADGDDSGVLWGGLYWVCSEQEASDG